MLAFLSYFWDNLLMKYDTILTTYLSESKEPIDAFAKRARVGRNTVFRAKVGGNVGFSNAVSMLSCAGYDVVIQPKEAPATQRTHDEVGGDAA